MTASPLRLFSLISLGLTVLVGIGYWDILHAPFNYDDGLVILHNEAIRTLDRYLQIHNLQYRQLFYLSFALNYHWGQDNPFGYHLFNVAVHLATSTLVLVTTYWTVAHAMDWGRAAALRISGFTALWFAVHPIQTEAVTYVSGRTSSMMAMFYLLSLLAFIYATMKSTRWAPAILAYGLCLLAGGLALFCKETAATLPLSLFLYDVCFMRNDRFKSFRLRLFLVYLPIPLLIAAAVLTSASMKDHVMQWMPRLELGYALEQAKILLFSMKMVLLPINQTFDYEFPHASMATDLLRIVTTGTGVLVVAFGLFQLYRKARWAAFGIAWYLLVLGPTNSFLPRMDLLSERNLYLPSFGLLLALAIFIEAVGFAGTASSMRKRIAGGTMILILLLSTMLLLHRNTVYENNTTLWEDALEKAPGKPRIYHNLSHFYTQAGDYENAFIMLKKLAASNATPYYRAYAHTNLGNIHALWGNMSEAERNFIEALRLYPPLPSSHFNIGVLYASKGMFAEANEAFQRAQTAQSTYERYLLPTNFSLYRGRVLLQLNQPDAAEKFIRQYLNANPGNPEGRLLLGQAQASRGQEELAIKQLSSIQGNGPVAADALYTLYRIYSDRGNSRQALMALKKSIAADASRPDRLLELARLEWKSHQDPKAIDLLKAALALNPPADLMLEIEALLTEIEDRTKKE